LVERSSCKWLDLRERQTRADDRDKQEYQYFVPTDCSVVKFIDSQQKEFVIQLFVTNETAK